MAKNGKHTALTFASRALSCVGEPLVDALAVSATVIGEPGIISAIVARGAKAELDLAVAALAKAGKPTHTEMGFELIWKIAHKSSVKPSRMKDHWRALLRSAMDREYPHEIRIEDIEFLDSLNPADVFLIDLLFNHAKEVHDYHASSKTLAHIRNVLGTGKSNIDDAISRGFIEAKMLLEVHHFITGSVCAFGKDEIGATLQNRSRDLLTGGAHEMAVIDVYGGVRHGAFHVYIPEDKNVTFSYRLGSSDYPEIFCIGHLTPQSKRLAKLLTSAK